MSNAVMPGNIIDLVKGQIGDQMLGQVKNLLGNEGPKASNALNSMLPALLSGLSGLSKTPTGAETLFNAVGQQDDGLLDNISAMLREGQGSSVVDQGSSLLGTLFGNSGSDTLGTVLSAFTGLSRGGTSSLMGIIAPIALGVIKRKFMGGVTNASGLANLLKEQQPNINQAMPAGLADKLQASNFLSNMAQPAAAPRAAQTSPTSSTHIPVPPAKPSGIKRYLLPLLGLLAVIWLGTRFLGGGAPDVADSAATVATDAAVDVTAIGDQLTGMFGTATDTLNGISDEATAQAAIPALTDLGSNLGNITGLIDKVPEAARGPLSSIISTGISTLQPIIDNVSAIPGVGAIIEPIVGPIMSTLNSLAG